MALKRFFSELSSVLYMILASAFFFSKICMAFMLLFNILPCLVYPFFPGIPRAMYESAYAGSINPTRFKQVADDALPVLDRMVVYSDQLSAEHMQWVSSCLTVLYVVQALASAATHYSSLPLLQSRPTLATLYGLRTYTDVLTAAYLSFLTLCFYPLIGSIPAHLSLFLRVSQLHTGLTTLFPSMYSLSEAKDALFMPPIVIDAAHTLAFLTPPARVLEIYTIILVAFEPGAYLEVTFLHLASSFFILFFLLPSMYVVPALARMQKEDALSKWGYMSEERVKDLEDRFSKAEPGKKKAARAAEVQQKKREMLARGVVPGKGPMSKKEQ
ncbi:hypothetical protein TeGR_g12487 [Tetraparma gracilis]|uniref:Uncharacterized protein n=1 Tax=Tetraparma gracilis TaxID=2962635 RepID=A0ABQ6MIU0_9STRA|nr:hypothetical protein TeGR_g12487 [Tetraparma gracilis]